MTQSFTPFSNHLTDKTKKGNDEAVKLVSVSDVCKGCQHDVCYVSYGGGACGGGEGKGCVCVKEGDLRAKVQNKKPVKRKQQKDKRTQKIALIDTTFSSFSFRFLVISL